MKISNFQTSLMHAIQGAVGKGGVLRENKMLFSGKTISQRQDVHVL